MKALYKASVARFKTSFLDKLNRVTPTDNFNMHAMAKTCEVMSFFLEVARSYIIEGCEWRYEDYQAELEGLLKEKLDAEREN
jgi:hypothetical protein